VRRKRSATLPAFTTDEFKRAKLFLATQVAQMMGRKLEEGDWSKVYCLAKRIPYTGWSNLNIDINHRGLGVEHKLLRRPATMQQSIKSVCGTSLMHPSATRSIRIDNLNAEPNEVMRSVFQQYAKLIAARRHEVEKGNPGVHPDMRNGWLLWEDSLTEFLYFETRMEPPNPKDYYAEWNETPAKGARKASRSLWIFDRRTNEKRYSVTTSAGIKIQPYFDVPPPSDANLYYLRAQNEPLDPDTVQIWVSASTARGIRRILGDLDKEYVSRAVLRAATVVSDVHAAMQSEAGLAEPIQLTREAFDVFQRTWPGVSDEHRAQLFLESLIAAS
jgi:hypothetical protein